MKSHLLFSVLLIASLLWGCGPKYQYVFTPPPTPEGRVCTSQCEIGKQQCYGFTQNAFNQCQMNHNMALQNYNQCRNYARNDRDGKGKNSCYYPPYTCNTSSYQCDENYRTCYQNCGGRVETFLIPDN